MGGKVKIEGKGDDLKREIKYSGGGGGVGGGGRERGLGRRGKSHKGNLEKQ